MTTMTDVNNTMQRYGKVKTVVKKVYRRSTAMAKLKGEHIRREKGDKFRIIPDRNRDRNEKAIQARTRK